MTEVIESIHPKVCPNRLTEHAIVNIASGTTVNNCIEKPKLYFDNLVDEYYQKGYRIFICEIGRGEETRQKSLYTRGTGGRRGNHVCILPA